MICSNLSKIVVDWLFCLIHWSVHQLRVAALLKIRKHFLLTVSYKIWVFLTVLLRCHSWTLAFLRRSAWCRGMRRASWSWPTRTWSVASTVPSRSCTAQPPALCSALFGPGMGLPVPGAHYCTAAEDQSHGDDISMAKAAGQGFVNLSHIHWLCPPGRLFLKCIFFSFPKPPQLKNRKNKQDKKHKRTKTEPVTNEYDDIFLDLGNKQEKKPVRFWTFFWLLLFVSTFGVYFFWRGCTKILIFHYCYQYVWVAYRVYRELESHRNINTRAGKTKEQRCNEIQLSIYFYPPARDHTPSFLTHSETGRTTRGSHSTGTAPVSWNGSAHLCLGGCFPLRKDKPLGCVRRVSKTGKIYGFLTF